MRDDTGDDTGAVTRERETAAPEPVEPAPVAEAPDHSRIGWDEVTEGMMVNLDIGYGLVPLVDERKGAPLMGRITGVRRQLSKELGFVVPQVKVRDDINLAPYTYRLLVGGVVVAAPSGPVPLPAQFPRRRAKTEVFYKSS